MITRETRAALLFNPRGHQLTLGEQRALWEASFFDRDDDDKCYRLFYYPDGTQVWLAKAVWRSLTDSRKRKPFEVPAANTLPGRPAGRLFNGVGLVNGWLTPEQERVRKELTRNDP
jgi:hypothetical protein